MAMTKKQKRESALLKELQTDHGYLLLKEKRKDDRFGTQFRTRGKRMVTVPAVNLRVSVPAASALGAAFTTEYESEKPARRRPR